MELSLRLSQVDPQAAKKLRLKKERKIKKETAQTSDGESIQLDERFVTWFIDECVNGIHVPGALQIYTTSNFLLCE